jgi:CheY-like chemotaxis protein
LAGNARRSGLELTVAIDPNVPRTLRGDPTRLRQILLNLLGNAIKFTKQGWVSIACRHEGGGELHFAVEDTGVGIPDAAMPHLFAPFQQADSSTTRQFGGTGLGLSIARRLARLMGGDISVTSRVGQGSRFEVTVRLTVVRDAPPMPKATVDRVAIAVRSDRLAASLSAWCRSLGYEPERIAATGSPLAPSGERTAREQCPILLTDGTLDPSTIASAGRQRRPPIVLCPTGTVLSESWRALGARRISLPVRHSALATALAGESAAPTPIPSNAPARTNECSERPHRVLVVEDNPVNQRVAEAMLRNLGAAPSCVASGEAALVALAEQDFDLILLDMAMPGMDGPSTARAVRSKGSTARNRQVPIVALTANVLPEHRAACFAAGMDDFLAKPLRKSDLADTLATHLSRRRLPPD